MKFIPASLEAVKNNLDSPQSLDELLPQLEGEFADYVAIKAKEVALADGVVTDEESTLLDAINQHFARRTGSV